MSSSKGYLAWACVVSLCAACSTTGSVTEPEQQAPASVAPDRIAPAEYMKGIGVADGVVVELTRDAILLDGEAVVELVDGAVDPKDKRGGEGSLLISRLLAGLEASQSSRCARGAGGEPVLGFFASSDVPYRLLSEAMYTALMAQWKCSGEEAKRLLIPTEAFQSKVMVASASGWYGFDVSPPTVQVEAPGEREYPVAASPEEIRPLDLKVTLEPSGGVRIHAMGEPQPAIEGCPADGPTVCALSGGKTNTLATYATLLGYKQVYGNAREVTFAATPDVSMGRVAELLNVVRTRRAGGSEDGTFSDLEAFDAAEVSHNPNHQGEALFPDVILSVAPR